MSRSEGNLSETQKQVNQFDKDWRRRRQMSIDEATERFTAEQLASIKKLPKAEKQEIAVDLLMAGCSRNTAEILLGVQHGQISLWVNQETATMQAKFHDGMSRKALLEFPETFNRLADLRFHPNAETARKASLDMARAAGRGIDAPAPSSMVVNMNGKQNQFNLTTRELEEQISKIAESLGPDAVALAKGELGVKPTGFLEPGRKAKNGRDPFEADPGTPAEGQRKPD